MGGVHWKWYGIVVWAVVLVVWTLRLVSTGPATFQVDGVNLMLGEGELFAYISSSDTVPEAWTWPRGTRLSSEPRRGGYTVEVTPTPDQSVSLHRGFARVRLASLLPTDTSPIGGAAPCPLRVRGQPGQHLALLTPAGLLEGRPYGKDVVFEGLLPQHIKDSLLVSGTVERIPMGDQAVHLVQTHELDSSHARKLTELLEGFASILGPSPLPPILVVIPPTPMTSIPTEQLGSSLVVNWCPRSSQSSLNACRNVLMQSLPQPRFALDRWAHGALATALSIQRLQEQGTAAYASLWEDLEAEYVFLCASRDGPFKGLSQASPKTAHFLEFIKGPLLLREIVEEHLITDSVKDPQATYRSALLALPEMSLEQWASGHLDSAGCERLTLAVHKGGMLRRVMDKALNLVPPGPQETAPVWDLVFALTSGTENFLEACGCRAVQGAGLPRRVAHMNQERLINPALVGLDLGNFAPRMTPDSVDHLVHSEVAFHLRSMVAAGYEGFALGSNELFLGPDLVGLAVEAAGGRLGQLESQAGGKRAHAHARRINKWGQDILLLSIPQLYPRWIQPEEYQRRTAWVDVEDPRTLVWEAAAAATELYDSPETLVVVYGTMVPWQAQGLVEEFPGIDILVSGDKYVPATGELDDGGPQGALRMGAHGYLGDTLVVFSNMGEFGVAFLRMCLDGTRVGDFEVEGVRLRSTMPKDESTVRALDGLYRDLEFPPLATRPIFEEMALEQGLLRGQGGYVGVEVCKACHLESYNTWKAGPHGGAFKTLLTVHRDRVPKCVQCHVTGMGLPTGFRFGQESQPDLRNVQCEVCHGPGQVHAVDRPGDPDTIRRTMKIESCERCHDVEHSEPLRARLSESWSIGSHRPSGPSHSSQD